MRRLLLVAVVLAMTLCLSAPAVLAASPSGNGTTTHRYSSTYYDFLYGAMVVCKGIHQSGPNWPGDATSGGRDVFKCRSISGPFLYLDAGQVFEIPPYLWGSDYFGSAFGIGVGNTYAFKVRVSGDNRSYHAKVYYY